jgi:hypothetical protein
LRDLADEGFFALRVPGFLLCLFSANLRVRDIDGIRFGEAPFPAAAAGERFE